MRKASKKAPQTPATQVLDRIGVSYRVHEFVHDDRVHSYGDEAIAALGAPADRVFKTLIVRVDGREAVAILPAQRRLQLRRLAAALGAKHAELAERAMAERKTGYVVGGISPLGQRTQMPIVMDSSILDAEAVFVSGGRRGVDIEISSVDLVKACAAIVAEITVESDSKS